MPGQISSCTINGHKYPVFTGKMEKDLISSPIIPPKKDWPLIAQKIETALNPYHDIPLGFAYHLYEMMGKSNSHELFYVKGETIRVKRKDPSAYLYTDDCTVNAMIRLPNSLLYHNKLVGCKVKKAIAVSFPLKSENETPITLREKAKMSIELINLQTRIINDKGCCKASRTIEAHKKLKNCRNVIDLEAHGVKEGKNCLKMTLVMDFYPYNLVDFLRLPPDHFSDFHREYNGWKVALEVSKGLLDMQNTDNGKECHLHRDLKPDNIMVSNVPHDIGLIACLRIIDLESVCSIEDTIAMNRKEGTIYYLAPERVLDYYDIADSNNAFVRQVNPSLKKDQKGTPMVLWTLGMILYNVKSSRFPPWSVVFKHYIDNFNTKFGWKVPYEKAILAWHNSPWPRNKYCLENLMRRLLQLNPDDRPTTLEVYELAKAGAASFGIT